MQLSTEQIKAIDAGEAVGISLEETRCVVVREDVYEQLSMRSSDGLPPGVVGELANEAMGEYDADDPLLESYQKV